MNKGAATPVPRTACFARDLPPTTPNNFWLATALNIKFNTNYQKLLTLNATLNLTLTKNLVNLHPASLYQYLDFFLGEEGNFCPSPIKSNGVKNKVKVVSRKWNSCFSNSSKCPIFYTTNSPSFQPTNSPSKTLQRTILKVW